MVLVGCENPSMKAFSFLGLDFNQTGTDLEKKGFVCDEKSSTTDINCKKNSEGKQVVVNLFQNGVIRSITLIGKYTGDKQSCDDSLFAIESLLEQEFNAQISYEFIIRGKSRIRINDKTISMNGETYKANDGSGVIVEKLDYKDPEHSDSRIISYFGQCVMLKNLEYTLSARFENKNTGTEDFLKTLKKDSI
jgi:hypothetical protein